MLVGFYSRFEKSPGDGFTIRIGLNTKTQCKFANGCVQTLCIKQALTANVGLPQQERMKRAFSRQLRSHSILGEEIWTEWLTCQHRKITTRLTSKRCFFIAINCCRLDATTSVYTATQDSFAPHGHGSFGFLYFCLWFCYYISQRLATARMFLHSISRN